MGFDPDEAYPKSNHDQWLGDFGDARAERPVALGTGDRLTAADNGEARGELPEQEGKVGFDEFTRRGAPMRSSARRRPAQPAWGYRDDKLGIGEDGTSVTVADPHGRVRPARASWKYTASSKPTT